ncbi:MAG: hypothetical protein ACYCYK_08575 [Candidatus Dormibacteria bacterium]
MINSLGRHLAHLAGSDLKVRVADGGPHSAGTWARRKGAIARESSSRWAGTLSKATAVAYDTDRRNQQRHLAELEKAVRAISEKLARSGGELEALLPWEQERAKSEGRKPKHLDFGHRSASEHPNEALPAPAPLGRQRRPRQEGPPGRPGRGDRADHEKVALPIVSAEERVRLRAAERERAASAGRKPKNLFFGYCSQEEARAERRRLACLRTAPEVLGGPRKRYGNETVRVHPEGTLEVERPATVRDGHLRQAITAILDLAEAHRYRLVLIENLGLEEMRATGRERYGAEKWFPNVVCGMPTTGVRSRLLAMITSRRMPVTGVPAAYSLISGRAYWEKPLSTLAHQISGHTAAAVVLGRRSLGHFARRRTQASPGVTASNRGIEAAGPPAGAESYQGSSADKAGARCQEPCQRRRRQGVRRGPPRSLASARFEAAKAQRQRSWPGKTVRPGRASLQGTPWER